MLRFQVARYAISRWGIEQLGLSFGLIFLLFPMKVARGHANKSQGKPPAQPSLATLDSSSGSVFIASTKKKVRLQALRGLTMMMMMTIMIVMVTIRMTGIVINTQ